MNGTKESNLKLPKASQVKQNKTASANTSNSTNVTKAASGLDMYAQKSNLAQEQKSHKNIFGKGVMGDGKPMAVPKAPEEEKMVKKDFKISSTSGVIDLGQKQMFAQQMSQVDQKLEAEVFAGEKTKEIAEIEKIDKRIQLMHHEIENQKSKLDQTMDRLQKN